MIIRPETHDDREAISRIVGAALGSDAEPALIERIRASDEYVAELALVAERAPEAAQLLRLPGFTQASIHGGGAVVYPPAFDGME